MTVCVCVCFLFRSPNTSGSSTPTYSLNESSSDGLESDQQSQLPSASKDDEYDPNQPNEYPPMQNRSVRNPLSVMQRLSSLMAIRNNVSNTSTQFATKAFQSTIFRTYKSLMNEITGDSTF